MSANDKKTENNEFQKKIGRKNEYKNLFNNESFLKFR